MDLLRNYILSIIGGAMVCGVVLCLTPEGKFNQICRFLCGVFLTVSLLQPLTEIDLSGIAVQWNSPEASAADAAAMGQNYAHSQLRDGIKQEAEEYILDKAQAFGAAVTAEVHLSEDDIPIPEEIILYGSVEDQIRQHLEAIITTDLGIAKENQQWIQTDSGKN